MKAKNKTIFTIAFSALIGFLLGAVIVFIGVSTYLGRYTADIAARTAASQLSLDVAILENLESGQRDKAIKLVKGNIGEKYTYISSLRHDASEFTPVSYTHLTLPTSCVQCRWGGGRVD